ncbi:MAG: hypothetical protein OXB84_06290 [Halobacteriovoraceae bacterium]|nr:hypothetical protein [Halobacteriovoraceae bacterium]
METLSGIGKKSRHRLKAAIEASEGLLTPKFVSEVLSLSRFEAARLLSRCNKAGWLKRVKRGVYLPVQLETNPNEVAIEDSWLVAEKIFSPGYIGGFSAIKYWDFSEQIFENTVYFTTKQTPSKTTVYGGIKFKLKTIRPYKIFGTKTIWRNSVKIKISDPSKTIIDLLDDPVLGGGMRSIKDFFIEYWESNYKNIDLLIDYAEKTKNKTVFKRLGFLLETGDFLDSETINQLRYKISSGYSKFDTTMKNIHVIRKWNLKIPSSWKKEYDLKRRNS